MTDKHDIISLFESMIDEAEISSDSVMKSLSDTSSKIDKRHIRVSKKKARNTITSKNSNKEKDQNEDDETDLDTKKSVPKALQPRFENPEEEEEDNDINLEDAHDFYSFLDRLNLFRAAGSLKDSDVIERLKDYFKNLEPGAREAIFIVINSLTGIANLVVDGNSADLPNKFGIKIDHGNTYAKSKSNKGKEEDSEKEELVYNSPRIKKDKEPKAKKSKSNTSSLNPISIVPESLQDKTEILKVLNELRSQ
jgi:hypothetical protein